MSERAAPASTWVARRFQNLRRMGAAYLNCDSDVELTGSFFRARNSHDVHTCEPDASSRKRNMRTGNQDKNNNSETNISNRVTGNQGDGIHRKRRKTFLADDMGSRACNPCNADCTCNIDLRYQYPEDDVVVDDSQLDGRPPADHGPQSEDPCLPYLDSCQAENTIQ